MWKDNKKRIRRFLRDPNANIWADGFLRRSWNDAQVDFSEATGFLDSIEALRVPPQYYATYMHDWEWQYFGVEKKYQCFKYYHQSQTVSCYKWETQKWLTSGTLTEEGTAFTHPFEAYMVTNANSNTPLWFPENFKKTRFIAWDNEPIEYLSKKYITSVDASWKTQSGTPFAYWREDELSNEFYLYPRLSSPTWDDTVGSALDGEVLFTDDEEADIEFDTIIDIPGFITNQNNGIAIDTVDTDNNVLIIYDTQPVDVEADNDEPDYPKFLQKYIEYAVLEVSYSANTDGRISSLQGYWKWRKELGLQLIKKYKWKRLADRDFRLTSKGGTSQRRSRGPRLPDTYPNVR